MLKKNKRMTLSSESAKHLTRVGAKAQKLHKLFARAKFAHKLFVFSLNTSTDPVAPLLADTLALDPMTILIHGLHIQSIAVQA